MLPCVVVTEVDANTNTNEADGVVAQVLGDTNSLITELNAEGADVSGASTQAVSADNCTSNTIVSNSNRGITGTPCVGATGEACDFECFAGYTKFGEHTCKPDGKFCKSHRRPCRRNPVSLWPHRHGELHKISLPRRLHVLPHVSWRGLRSCGQGAFPVRRHRRPVVRDFCGTAAAAARLHAWR